MDKGKIIRFSMVFPKHRGEFSPYTYIYKHIYINEKTDNSYAVSRHELSVLYLERVFDTRYLA